MPNNRVKTSKALQSKKGKAVLSKLHPHSRRAKQLTRVTLRTNKLQGDKRDRRRAESSRVDRLLWFCNALDPQDPHCALQEVHELVGRFVARNGDELEEEKRQRRPGRPKSVKQERLEAEQGRDVQEYKTGFVLPDLTSPAAVVLLRQWASQHAGDPSFLPRLRLIRVTSTEPTSVRVEQEGAADKVAFGAPLPPDEDMADLDGEGQLEDEDEEPLEL